MKIWIDAWIPGHQALQMEISEIEVDNTKDIVNNLIDRDIMWWKADKVRTLLNPYVVVDILKILCLTHNEDQWIWT